MDIPVGFQQKIIGCFREEGEKWLAALPEKVAHYAEQWGLTIQVPVSNLSYNYVLFVEDLHGQPFVLKLGVPNFDCRNEMDTVQQYDGKGCARLVKADREEGVMLLERLSPGTMLSDLQDEEEVLRIFLNTWKAIRRELPTDREIPMITDWAGSLTAYAAQTDGKQEIPIELIHKAQEYINKIMEQPERHELLHGDLHHENILYSEELGWLAIDPKGVGGDPCFDLISFMINHLMEKNNPRALLEYRVNRISEELNLERIRLLETAVGLSTLYACWAIEDHSDWQDTYQCAVWFNELLEETRINNLSC
ncbi:aminoglycoside phosphotransferase family protein [Sporosarcina cyprini]|uniref:aminoglycoside phosphotransferase family protein n=1 Tax=Sporosarcina cyprini TaxID=2910523 RepID=UPI001EDDE685|nr:aminoglycoside phosphotransferase family protein [Sporosarcina cyprini]MCG3087518.1 aminoglycoside phosphotransferase family protein [Sporosarcina cyprini]